MKTKLTSRQRILSEILSAESFLGLNLTAFMLLVLATCFSASVADTSEWRQLFNGWDQTGSKHVGPGSHYE